MAKDDLIKQAIDYLSVDIKDEDTWDDVKQKIDSGFVKRDYQAIKDDKELYGKVTGAYNESNKVAFKRIAKEHGIDLSGADFDKMNIGEVISNVLPSAFKNYSTELATLKESASKGTNEKVAAVQSEFEKYKAEIGPKVQDYDKLHGEYETFKQTVAQKEIKEKIGKYDEDEWGKFGFSQNIDPFAKKGFIDTVNGKFQSKVFDDGIYPVDENGNRIPDPSRIGGWKHKSQLAIEMADEAEKAGAKLRAKVENKQQQQQTERKTFSFKTEDNKDQPQGRKINTGTRVKSVA